MSDYEIVRYLVENPTVEWEEACRLVGKTPPKLRARRCVLLPETWAGRWSDCSGSNAPATPQRPRIPI